MTAITQKQYERAKEIIKEYERIEYLNRFQLFDAKIVRCEMETYWYAKEIGKSFIVVDYGPNHEDFECVDKPGHFILKEDCKVRKFKTKTDQDK